MIQPRYGKGNIFDSKKFCLHISRLSFTYHFVNLIHFCIQLSHICHQLFLICLMVSSARYAFCGHKPFSCILLGEVLRSTPFSAPKTPDIYIGASLFDSPQNLASSQPTIHCNPYIRQEEGNPPHHIPNHNTSP